VTESVSFPRLQARTQRFTLGEPRSISVTDDGATVLFIRTADGTSRAGLLWAFDVAAGTERLLVDPTRLLGDGGEQLSDSERARRERARESGAGIVAYSVDHTGSTAVFALSGAVWTCPLAADSTVGARALPTAGPVIDPRIDPTGRHIAYAADGALRVITVDGADDRALAEPDADHVVWGQAEFVAAEEMDRSRGFWWAPDGSGLLAERYDETPVPVWYVADPTRPAAVPAEHRYPVAGSTDAEVQLWYLGLDGTRRQVGWDSSDLPYLTRVSWTEAGDPLVQVMSRDQRRVEILAVDPHTGDTRVVAEQTDSVWLDLILGLPAWSPDGRLLTRVDDADTHRLALDGDPFSPVGAQVRHVISVDETGVLATVTGEDPIDTRVCRIGFDGSITDLGLPTGTNTAITGGPTTVVSRTDLTSTMAHIVVRHNGEKRGELRGVAADPGFLPDVTMLRTGSDELATAVLFPSGHRAGSYRLPVLMAPYGGPHGQLVRSSARMFLQGQWLADQGFAVIVADGRGTPGRGPTWEKAVRDEFATVTLDDQVAALDGVVAAFPDDVDPNRVGILGWSYGGYLSALAVLARPDKFNAAVAGAPVTDWRLYDTFYTERYLGHPADQPEVYERNSLTRFAPELSRPLLLVHGMADDNVVVAHTLRLSAALLEAGRPHSVLPLSGVTHMASQEEVAENLLLLQVDFLRTALAWRTVDET
jgi:dipeptidyl-peptidase-4